MGIRKKPVKEFIIMTDISHNASQSTMRSSDGKDGARRNRTDDTDKFREYMLTRVARRERRLKLLLWTLTVFAVFLAAFIVMTYVFDVW